MTIVVAGRLDGSNGFSGINSNGIDTEIDISASGVASGATGINANGVKTRIINDGSIYGYDGRAAILGLGYGIYIHNTGRI
jgi:hypothetical protein